MQMDVNKILRRIKTEKDNSQNQKEQYQFNNKGINSADQLQLWIACCDAEMDVLTKLENYIKHDKI